MHVGPQVGAGSPISEKTIWWVCYGHIYIQIHIYIIYICAIYTTHWICGAFREVYQSGALLLVRVESPISQHTAVLLGCVKPRCPRRFCRRGGDVLVQVFPRSQILIANFNRVAWSNRRLNLLLTIIGTYIKAASCAREGGVAWISGHGGPVGLRGAIEG